MLKSNQYNAALKAVELANEIDNVSIKRLADGGDLHSADLSVQQQYLANRESDKAWLRNIING